MKLGKTDAIQNYFDESTPCLSVSREKIDQFYKGEKNLP